MNNLKFCFLLTSIILITSSCNQESSDILDNSATTELRHSTQSEYEYYYDYFVTSNELINSINLFLENEKSRMSLDISTINEFSDLATKFSDLKLDENLNNINPMLGIENLSNEDFALASLALLNATNEIVNATSNGLSSGNYTDPTDCLYDYGIFYNGIEILDCNTIYVDHGCCASLICEQQNCEHQAYIEVLDQLGIDVNQALTATFTTLLSSIRAGLQGGYVSLGTLITAKFLVGLIHYVDLIYDLTACAWDPIINYSEWTEQCGDCNCPITPKCNYNSFGDPLGGYGPFIPDGC